LFQNLEAEPECSGGNIADNDEIDDNMVAVPSLHADETCHPTQSEAALPAPEISLDGLCDHLRKLEPDLFAIDGPPRTWATKKRLRHRIPKFISKISSISSQPFQSPLQPHSQIWIPIEPQERDVIGHTVAVCQDCLDDCEPRGHLLAWSPANLVEIDADGDYLLRYDAAAPTSWILRDRVSLLRRQVAIRTIIDEHTDIVKDFTQWKHDASETRSADS
jgi:hypothetical protein